MGKHTFHVVEVEAGVKREHIAVAVGAGYVAVSGGMPIGVRLPDFVTARARAPLPMFVINGGSGNDQSCDDEQGQRRSQPAAEKPSQNSLVEAGLGVGSHAVFQFLTM
jgi:hypothetical protein